MAKRSFKVSSFTPVAVADGAAFTDAGYAAIQGGGTGQTTNVLEVYLGGQAGASSPTLMLLARDSTLGATLTALSTGNSDAPLNPATAALALPVLSFVASTTKPVRSSLQGLLNLSYNAFGGIVRWVAAPGEECTMIGTAASLGEISLSCYSPGGTPGLSGAHIIYETF